MYLLPLLAVKKTAGHVYKDDFVSRVTGQKPTMIYAMAIFFGCSVTVFVLIN